jgi:orotate phosphoribosyltransferase-like protein
VGGSHGQYLFCPACKALPAEQRPLYSQLPRDLALRLTCERLAALVAADGDLAAHVVAACQQAVRQAQAPDPARLDELRRRDKQLSGQIQFLLQNAGETDVDRQESATSLDVLRRSRAEAAAELSRLEAGMARPTTVPTAEEVQAQLRDLSTVMLEAAQGESGEAMASAREILQLLTGGRIELFQQGERKAQRGWLQGRFHVQLLPYLLDRTTGVHGGTRDGTGVEVVLDYREPVPYEAESERAKALYDQGLMHRQIAAALGCGRNWVTRLLRHWFESRRMDVPDGRKRRSSLARKQVGAALYKQLSDAAKAMWDEGLADVQIAERLGCSPPTVAAAVAHWHTVRGMAVPTHAERRAALVERMKGLYDQGRLVKEIAGEVGMSSRSVTLLLRERFQALGQPMADGRKRRRSNGGGRQGSDERPGSSASPAAPAST